ncbi:hypothetical protein GCM10009527_002050 [Actinomadura nitritigenes]|uniref:hypothetical protein n=1 Tax=Actinomadura nitritigenes TaxID=134602 RepID=UPI001FB6969B|nr:hypothetical protein [Actinomadura nitritigenes]
MTARTRRTRPAAAEGAGHPARARTSPVPQSPKPRAATGAAAARQGPERAREGSDGEGRLVERVAEAVAGCRSVAGLTAGPRARIMTYRAGRPFAGVAVRDAEIEVGVVALVERPLPETAEDVRRAVRPLAGDRPVHVLIGDIAEGGAT